MKAAHSMASQSSRYEMACRTEMNSLSVIMLDVIDEYRQKESGNGV